jgi:hypothetical protein
VSWSRVGPWLALGLIFAVGMVTGAALTIGFGIITSHPPSETQIRAHWQGRLNERLNLTPDQQAQVGPILADAAKQIQTLHEDEVGRLAQIMQATNAKIIPLLTTAQKIELRKMERERQRYFSGQMPGWGMQPHGPQHPGHGMPGGGQNFRPNGGFNGPGGGFNGRGPNGGQNGGPNGPPNTPPNSPPGGPPDGGAAPQ